MNDLTTTEQANARAALRFLRARLGDWKMVAKALRVNVVTLRASVRAAKPVSASLAFRVARFADASVDDVLAGRFPPAGTCPLCGHVKPAEAAQ